jgi:hypothetical protein
MGTVLPVNRPIWRWFLTLILSIPVSAASLLGIGITTAHPAAASTSPLDGLRGPSAAVDSFGNQYVFWKGEDRNLWEASHNTSTGQWDGPCTVRNGIGPTRIRAG